MTYPAGHFPEGWRTKAQVYRRHRFMVGLRRDRYFLKEIARAVQEKFGGPLLDHSSVAHHVVGMCGCARAGLPVAKRRRTVQVAPRHGEPSAEGTGEGGASVTRSLDD